MPLQKVPQSSKSDICQRLKQARLAAGFPTAKEFAEKNLLKISTYTLHEAGTRQMSLEVIDQYATLLQININWLLTGKAPKDKSRLREVPIIQWTEIKIFPHLKLENKNWTTADIDLSPTSFALTVENDAMEPRYPEGTIIIVDCDLEPKNKDFALIFLKEKKLPVFKQLVLIEGEYYAKSLNPDYKPLLLSKQDQILGKVVQAKLIF